MAGFAAIPPLTHLTSLPAEEPWSPISRGGLSLDLVWSYAQRFCREQLVRDQKSGIVQLTWREQAEAWHSKVEPPPPSTVDHIPLLATP